MKIEFMCHSGDDLLVVNAARTSFDKESFVLDESDEKLIEFLAKHGHVLPFRHPQITLRLTAPLFVIRQLDKHQVGFSTSEISRRYVTGNLEFYEPFLFRIRPKNIKQGSVVPTEGDVPEWWDQDNRMLMREAIHVAERSYEAMLANGVAPEQARMVLPQAMYTTQVKTGSLLGWSHLVHLRTEETAQREVQMIAHEIEKVVSALCPVSWAALKRHGY